MYITNNFSEFNLRVEVNSLSPSPLVFKTGVRHTILQIVARMLLLGHGDVIVVVHYRSILHDFLENTVRFCVSTKVKYIQPFRILP